MELIAGLALAASFLHRGAIRILLGLTALFIFVNAQAMIRGIDPDCGCFGEMMKIDITSRMVLLVVQLLVLIFLMTKERSVGNKVFRGSKMRLPG